MEKIEVRYNFKYSEIWDEDQELNEEKTPLINDNKDGFYTFVIFPPTEEAIKEHVHNELGNLVKEGKIDYYSIKSIILHRPNGFKAIIPLDNKQFTIN
jgi:hypothetical protein